MVYPFTKRLCKEGVDTNINTERRDVKRRDAKRGEEKRRKEM
jgi:hypothetical protein